MQRVRLCKTFLELTDKVITGEAAKPLDKHVCSKSHIWGSGSNNELLANYNSCHVPLMMQF